MESNAVLEVVQLVPFTVTYSGTALRKTTLSRPVWIGLAYWILAAGMAAEWKDHDVRQLNGGSGVLHVAASAQLISEQWGRSAQMPYLVYMPEKDELLMLFLSERPTRALLTSSADHGATWSTPAYMHLDAAGKPDTPYATALTYLGAGRVLSVSAEGASDWNWVSGDFGHTWRQLPRPPAFPGKQLYSWDPFFVDAVPHNGHHPELVESGYVSIGKWEEGGYSQGVIRFSPDEGQTWGPAAMIPQWRNRNEVVISRAKNGDWIAACRSDSPARFRRLVYDNYSGFGTSTSKDRGKTWSEVNVLFDWGRHHPSMVVLPDGDVVMTYAVRRGYPRTPDGYPQMGIEAVVSHDNGRTWDLDHRYLLVTWAGLVKGPDGAYIAQSQSTSSLLLPDGSILTAYGGAQRAVRTTPGASEPRDIGLIRWRLNRAPLKPGRTIANAPFDSDLRNRLDLNRLSGARRTEVLVDGKKNIAVPEEGVRITASATDQPAMRVLRDDYVTNLVTFQTVPAWLELNWKRRRRIDEVRIHPGAPAIAKQPSTECAPLDYRLQYRKAGKWLDLVPPVTNAQRYKDFDPKQRTPDILDREFEYVHRFPPIPVEAIRLYITRSSDQGRRYKAAPGEIIPEGKRETVLREIEVLEAEKE